MLEVKTKTKDSSLYKGIVIKRVKIHYNDLINPKPWPVKNTIKHVYTATLILNKEEHAEIIKDIYNIEEKLHQERLLLDSKAKKPESILIEGSERAEIYKEYVNSFYFQARQDKERHDIKVFNKNQDLIMEEGIIYPGCIVTAEVTMANISARNGYEHYSYLRKIQLVKRGPEITKKSIVSVDNDQIEAFEDYSNEEDEIEMDNTVPFSFDADVINSFDEDDLETIRKFKM